MQQPPCTDYAASGGADDVVPAAHQRRLAAAAPATSLAAPGPTPAARPCTIAPAAAGPPDARPAGKSESKRFGPALSERLDACPAARRDRPFSARNADGDRRPEGRRRQRAALDPAVLDAHEPE